MVELIKVNTNKKVQILLSTYNGEQFLKEQLDSILRQDYPYISILIRDDGSIDNTINIIQEYCNKYKNIKYYQGKNVGVVGSFFDLIDMIDRECEYIAFCDQDDIWLPNKISRAVEILECMSTEVKLYCSNFFLIDKNKHLYKKQKLQGKNPSFENAIIENICTGCTAVVSIKLIDYLKNIEYKKIIMHDWWFYLVATCFGEAYFDKKPQILYRQHENNIIGASNNFVLKNIKRIKIFKKNELHNQVSYFYKCYIDIIQDEYKRSIELFLNYKTNLNNKLQLLLSKSIKRQNKIDNIIFKVLFLFNLK